MVPAVRPASGRRRRSARRSSSWRSRTGPSRSAEMATRPARRPAEHVARLRPRRTRPRWSGARAGRRTPAGASRCRPPGSPSASQASHQDSGVVQRRSSQLQCQTSISGGRRRIGRTQLTGPANGWLTDSRPPAASVASSQSSGSRRKSIQPISPSAPACPLSVVTSWPGSSVIPYRRARRGQFGVVADRVVVGDRDEVQAASGREGGQFGDGQRAIGVHGVRVQVTGQPAVAAAGRAEPGAAAGPRAPAASGGTGGGRRPALRGVVSRRQPVARAVRRDAVHADHHLPRPGLDLPGQVPGRGRLGG